jgi:hypothetical protein
LSVPRLLAAWASGFGRITQQGRTLLVIGRHPDDAEKADPRRVLATDKHNNTGGQVDTLLFKLESVNVPATDGKKEIPVGRVTWGVGEDATDDVTASAIIVADDNANTDAKPTRDRAVAFLRTADTRSVR